MNVQESEMRNHTEQLEFAHENKDLFPAQYHAVVEYLTTLSALYTTTEWEARR